MQFSTKTQGRFDALIKLYADTFTASEGAEEGALIGGLVRDLLTQTPDGDIQVFQADDGVDLIGAAVFTPLVYPDSQTRVVILSPMAVATTRQRQGVGHALLGHALTALRADGVDVAITYGDPNFYERVGFAPIPDGTAAAPLPLSYPQGWIGQALAGGSLPDLPGQPRCVPALDRADIW